MCVCTYICSYPLTVTVDFLNNPSQYMRNAQKPVRPSYQQTKIRRRQQPSTCPRLNCSLRTRGGISPGSRQLMFCSYLDLQTEIRKTPNSVFPVYTVSVNTVIKSEVPAQGKDDDIYCTKPLHLHVSDHNSQRHRFQNRNFTINPTRTLSPQHSDFL